MARVALLPRPASAIDNHDWRAERGCRDLAPDVFFRSDTRAAKLACASCPVRLACLE